MARVVDYGQVVQELAGVGLRCVYHNSGAFGFGHEDVLRLGWAAEEDPTIRPEARAWVRMVPLERVGELFMRVWRDVVPGSVWLMPASHWAFELEFGNRWIEEVLASVGVDVSLLRGRNDGAAVEFSVDEEERVRRLVGELLARLEGSDYTICFPGRAVICGVHHHRQMWWQTTDRAILASIQGLSGDVG